MSKQIFSYTNHSRFDEPDIFISGDKDTVTNARGKTYFDCNSGLWNINHGYNNSAYTTTKDIHFYPTHFWSSTEVTEKAAEEICKWFGYNRVFFGNSGSDAIDTAIYIARYFTNKQTVLSFNIGYHGPNTQSNVYDSYTALIDAVNSQIAAVIVEPIMVTNGVVEFDKQVLQELFTLKQKHDFCIIFDETVTAMGRGDYSFDYKPDILIASKGLTNGTFPLSAVLVNSDIGEYIKNTDSVFEHGYTMSGHPQGSHALLETIKQTDVAMDTIYNKQKAFCKMLDDNKLQYTNRGHVFGIHVKDGIYIRRELQGEGYLVRQSNDTLLFLPMLVADPKNYSKFFELVATLSK